MITISPAVEVVTDGLAVPGTAAHRRQSAQFKDGQVTANSQVPACQPQAVADPARWKSYGSTRAIELGAVPCTNKACYGGAA